MTVRDDLLPIVYSVRAIPGQFGIRMYSLTVRVSSWSGAHPGDGIETVVSTTAITEAGGQPPKVRFLNDEERALGGLPDGTVDVGPITPDHPGGGTSLAVLAPSTDGTIVHYILTGPDMPTGATFERVSIGTDHALHYTLRLKPVAEK